MDKPLIIGFTGKAGAGKTTAAKAAQHFIIGSVIRSFATPLKEAVKKLFLFSEDQVYGSYEQKVAIDPRWGVSPREVLQKIGTDCIRETLCKDFHVKRLEAEIEDNPYAPVIIDDVRFVDEAQMILMGGGILIAIRRPPETEEDHASERPPYALATHEVVNSGSLHDFTKEVCIVIYEELKNRHRTILGPI